ncbi:thioesterase II family protein [Streptomyces omiyaensis]|uniref:Thioesterase II family protein n=1 Tax=Streptomyces omiyaensis TaxID=68247 RepID=A0ABW7BVP5_9ACTN|nr:alpha/beta fold hydrolase [Streptomyces omiyaensis]GGY73584.1 thioesterase [Streptomyces omiyaensis]
MGTHTRSRWFVGASRDEPRECALYAFPHAGAGVTTVRPLCLELADAYDAFGVRLPGRESRLEDPVETEMPVLADKVAAELLRHAQGRPVVLYGHCAGSAIAYEVARRLGPGRVRALVVSSHPAPGSLRREPTWGLPRPEFLKQVVADGYLPSMLLANEELLDIVEPALRADYRLVEEYELELYERGGADPVAVPTVAVFGRDDHTVEAARIEAWEALTTGPFRLVSLPGGHDLPTARPAELAAAVREALAGG